MTDITQIPDEKLTHTLYMRGKAQAVLERDWVVADNQRLIVLQEVAQGFKGDSGAEAERKARVSKEYRAHVEKMGDIKGRLILARVKYNAVDAEIKMRLSKKYQDRREYTSGSINT